MSSSIALPEPTRVHTRIRAVSRAVQLLLYLAAHDGGGTARDAATALGWPVSTTYHLLNTLVDERLLAKDSRYHFHLGPVVKALSDAYDRQTAPPEQLLAPLHRLAQETGESAYLSAWRHGEVTVLASAQGSHAVRVQGLGGGFTGVAHARASGKLLLAFARPEVRRAYLEAHPPVALTAQTIVDERRLAEEFEEIRERGYATDVEEFREGVACVSVPIVELGVVIAVYTLTVPVERFRERREVLLAALLATARSVSRRADFPDSSGGEPVVAEQA